MEERKRRPSTMGQQGITCISVAGFKAIDKPQSIDIRPLTVLAGANSSGKSSMLQPLLLLKQTLEASFDPGPILLDGPNVRFTSVDQILSRRSSGPPTDAWQVSVALGTVQTFTMRYGRRKGARLDILEMTVSGDPPLTLRPGMTHEELVPTLPANIQALTRERGLKWSAVRNRCFLEITSRERHKDGGPTPDNFLGSSNYPLAFHLHGAIHLPGLRGNPERTYPATAVSVSAPPNLTEGSSLPGTFEKYVASVILQWQTQREREKLRQLGKDLESLGLTWRVSARPISDTSVELHVGRLPHKLRVKPGDMVSVADVGLGIAQTLPVIVALLVAQPAQLVYLEQPELHLHPRAQLKLPRLFARAAQRGVKVVVETHSSLVLRGIQTLIAKGELSPDLVKLHWFTRSARKGSTSIYSAGLDEDGAFGPWPEDFDDVAMEAEKEYLDAVGAKR